MDHIDTIERDGWTLVIRDGEPMVADEVIAAHVQADTYKLRRLIERHRKAGNLKPTEVLATVGKTGGRPGRSYILTEADALFIITRSEAPRAIEMTKVMIQVFRQVWRGMLPAARPDVTVAQLEATVAELAALRAETARHAAEIADMRRELASGVIGRDVAAREILAPLRRIAGLLGEGTPARRGAHRRYQNRLGNLLGFVGRGAAWAQLPRRLLEVAQRALAGWLDEAIATNRRAHPAQRPLPLH